MHFLSDHANEMSLPPTVLSCTEQMVQHAGPRRFTRSIREMTERGSPWVEGSKCMSWDERRECSGFSLRCCCRLQVYRNW